MHTLLDLRGDIPTFIWITDGKVHDVNVLDHLIPEPGAIYIMDRAYLDFNRLYQMHQSSAVFVTRSKTNTGLRRIYSHKIDKTTGIRYDQTVVPTGFYSKKDYPEKLRRIKYFLIITDLGEALYNLPKKLISKGSPASCHDTESG